MPVSGVGGAQVLKYLILVLCVGPYSFSSPMSETSFDLQFISGVRILRLRSDDGTNRLTRRCVLSLTQAVEDLAREWSPLLITGNDRFFSAGAELSEICALDGPGAFEFANMGQSLMQSIQNFPAPVCAAISGYCMGGGLDLALACHRRIAAPHAVFAHRGAALGLITGWGGTQRLPRLIGKCRALEMFVAAEKINAPSALRIGLIDAIAEDPVSAAVRRVQPSF
jgi:enoyl-CoA hydratase/carnithine racemase